MSAPAVRGAPSSDRGAAIRLFPSMLVVTFPAPMRTCSWAIVGGGQRSARHVAWIEVSDGDLRPPVDPRRFARDRLAEEGIDGAAVGLLTSRRVATFEQGVAHEGEITAYAVATVGLSNALRAGDPAGVAGRIGTINLLVHVSAALSNEGLLEASAIATEAKTAAVLEAGVTSRRTGRPATGTGTDCVVTACPAARSRLEPYAGKHTRIGAVVGAVAHQVVREGVLRWRAEHRGVRR